MAPRKALSPSSTVDFEKFRHIRVRPEDLEGPSESSKRSRTTCSNTLTALDVIVELSLEAWTHAKSQCRNGTDIPMFMEKWRDLVQKDDRSAVVALAHAVHATKTTLRQPSISIILDEGGGALYDVANANSIARENIWWPKISHIVPELSHWVLAIEAPNSQTSLQLLMEELLQSTFTSPYAMLGLQGQLCDGSVTTKIDAKPALFIGDRVLRTQQATHGALRVLGLSTFVATFWDAVLTQNEKSCSSCNVVRPPRQLKRCARCHCACYCNRDCQTAHFQYQHRMECNEWKDIYERYAGNPMIRTSIRQKTAIMNNLENFVYPKLMEESKIMYSLKAVLREDIISSKEQACLGNGWEAKLKYLAS
ncbi:expressed unknown protein [Seminavis robusta]|uniref:MYND-type domain-containing protein n=1 Tax=Seminavis robusta TaxID=568900 RepID=A0A9N8EEV6_9STRA|nr:expressed unknown protein [Seminavis robusta]|eukprot:Sro898_g217610.1 n/a (365) ;mRNA; f:24580-25674